MKRLPLALDQIGRARIPSLDSIHRCIQTKLSLVSFTVLLSSSVFFEPAPVPASTPS